MPKLFKNCNNNKFFLFLGFLFLAFFLFWPAPTLAFWETLRNAILFVPYATVSYLFIIALLISWGFAWITGFILDIVISPAFISLSYTNPATNQVIALGLSITQSFVNLILVLVLVYTALAIALRINETEAKKTLVRLIIVALLVNFAPVFCGLVVDVANIVMYYFLKPIEEGASGVLTQIGSFVDMVRHTIWGAAADLPQRLGVIMMGVVQIIVNIAMGVAFLLFAGIFLLRYIVIWVLVILAPLAFAFWVLPQTRTLWSKWLNQFIQWSVIGIPIAFFLYLAMSSFTLMTAAFKTRIEMPGIEATAIGFFNEVFSYFVVIVFLILGFTIGLQTGAMGGAAAIRVSGGAARLSGRMGRRIAGRVVGAKGKEWAAKWASARFMPEKIAEMKGLKGIAAKVGYGITVPITGSLWAVRRGLGEAGLRLVESEIKSIRGAEEKYKGKTAERKLSALRDSKIFMRDRVGILRQAIEEEQIDDIKKLGYSDSEIIKVGQAALRTSPEEFKKIRDAFPHLAEDMSKGFSETVQKAAKVNLAEALTQGYSSVMEKIIAEMRTVNVPKMDSSILFGKTAIQSAKEAAQKNWQAGHWAEAGKAFGREFCDAVRQDYSANPQNFTKSAQKYFTTSPAGKSLYGI